MGARMKNKRRAAPPVFPPPRGGRTPQGGGLGGALWQHTARALAAALITGTTAHAASSIQLQFQPADGPAGGPPITGRSTKPGFEGSIDATSFQWGVAVGIARPSTGAPQISMPSLSDITWTQALDTSYTRLQTALFTGGYYTSTVSFVDGRPNLSAGTYLSMRTDTSAISSLSISSGGDRPTISASEAFRSFNLTYHDPAAGAVDVFWNSENNLASGPTSRAARVLAAGRGAASGLYLRLGARSDAIVGDSTDRGYENWIKLNSFQMGVGVGLTPNSSGGFQQSTPSVSELTVTQAFDGAVPVILGNLLRGRSIGQATLEYVQGSAAGSVTAMQLELDDVIFSGLSLSSGGELPSVSESLNFSGFTQTTWNINNDGTRGAADVFSYDLVRKAVRGNPAPAASIAGFGAGMLAPIQAPIPEPQTWALMAGGIAMLALLRRRRPR